MPGEQRGFVCLYVPERITGRCLRLASLAFLSLFRCFPHSGFTIFLIYPLTLFSSSSAVDGGSSMAKVQHAGRNVIMLWLFRQEKIRRFVHSPEERKVRPFTGISDGPSIHRKIGRSIHRTSLAPITEIAN